MSFYQKKHLSTSGRHARNLNILEGPLLGKVFLFILPLIATNLLQTFYNAADMVIAGMSGVDGAIGSIGTTTYFINLIINIFVGFSIGANVVVARQIGKNDPDSVSRAVHTSLIMAVLFGSLCMLVGQIVSRPVLTLMGDKGHILDLATRYTRIYFLGTPFIALSNYEIAIFRAKGDTRTPLAVLSATGLLNVLMNLFFVLACGMSVAGVALATVLANAVAGVVLGLILMRDTGSCRLELKKLSLDRSSFFEIVRHGLPAAVQGVLFSISNVMIQSSIIGINNAVCPGGSDVIDGNAAGLSLEGFVYTAENSVYQASVTFASQHYGAGKFRREGYVMRCCYFATTCVAVFASSVIFLLRYQLVGLYVTAPMALETALTRIYIMVVPYFICSWMEVGSGILRGLGKSLTSTLISLAGSCLFRLLWIWIVVPLSQDLTIIYLSYPISWTLTGAAHLIFSLRERNRLIRLYGEERTAD